jgi:non-ribosomal peptide synthetase component F
VIYTSGSTGKPKGAMNEHRGVVNRLRWTQDYFRLTSEDVVLQKTTFCFDVSVWELLWPLVAGAKLVFAKPEGHRDNDYLKSIIEDEKNNLTAFCTINVGSLPADLPFNSCKNLRKVLCSGEALRISHVNLFSEKLPGAELYNLYGPTEAAIDVTCWSLPKDTKNIESVLIGKPVSNTSIYILDANNHLVPQGGIGELHIGGAQVGRWLFKSSCFDGAEIYC